MRSDADIQTVPIELPTATDANITVEEKSSPKTESKSESASPRIAEWRSITMEASNCPATAIQ